MPVTNYKKSIPFTQAFRLGPAAGREILRETTHLGLQLRRAQFTNDQGEHNVDEASELSLLDESFWADANEIMLEAVNAFAPARFFAGLCFLFSMERWRGHRRRVI